MFFVISSTSASVWSSRQLRHIAIGLTDNVSRVLSGIMDDFTKTEATEDTSIGRMEMAADIKAASGTPACFC